MAFFVVEWNQCGKTVFEKKSVVLISHFLFILSFGMCDMLLEMIK